MLKEEGELSQTFDRGTFDARASDLIIHVPWPLPIGEVADLYWF